MNFFDIQNININIIPSVENNDILRLVGKVELGSFDLLFRKKGSELIFQKVCWDMHEVDCVPKETLKKYEQEIISYLSKISNIKFETESYENFLRSELHSWNPDKWLSSFKRASELKDGFRELRKLVFDHTRELTYAYYSKDLEKIQTNTIFYDNAEALSFKQQKYETKISVLEGDCIEVGKLLLDMGLNPVILNMANRQKPGGGVLYGAGAQEENIFRRSNLFLSLYQFYDFPEEIKVKRSLEHSYPLNREGGGLYSKDITIFRSSEQTGYDILKETFKLSFVTVPAINRPPLKKLGNKYYLEDSMVAPTKVKLRAILNIALANGHDSIVLSAFGCGAFRNPPEQMAKLFQEVFEEDAYKSSFKEIVFAIIEDHNATKEHNPQGNLFPFQKVFSDFVFFWNEEDIYSNFYPSNFIYQEKVFSSSEQAFMYLKAKAFEDFNIAEQILNTKEPMLCKGLGRSIKNYNEYTWSKIREEKMFEVCYAKFSQNESLKQKLLLTKDKILVEASPYDKIWGVGLSEDNPKILLDSNWEGLNLLGKVLMKVRSSLC